MRQSTIFFLVAVLVLIWFGAEMFPGQQICVTSCYSFAGWNVGEQIVVVVIVPVLIVLAGLNQRKTEREREAKLGATQGSTSQTQKKETPDSENTKSPSA